MPRILLDQNAPAGLRHFFDTLEIKTATELGWAALSNGDLIAAADAAGFEVMITADRNLRYQQNLTGRSIAIVVLGTNRWKLIREYPEKIAEAVARCQRRSFTEINFPAQR